MATAPPTLTPIQQTSPYVLKSTGSYDLVTTASVPYGVYIEGPLSSSAWVSGAVDQVALTFKMLGGDVLDIELTENNVYTAFEMATLEYSTIINNHQAANVLSDFLGNTTGTFDHLGNLQAGELSSSLSGSHVTLKYPKFTFSYSTRVAEGFAGEAGFGDDARIYSASFNLQDDVQEYDLQKVIQDASVASPGTYDFATPFTGSVNNQRIAIRRVYYRSPNTMWRFYGYYGGLNVVGNLYTYGQYSDESTFEVIPAWQNKLQAMAYETNLYTRASHYAYEIFDNRIKVYPPPSNPGTGSPTKMWFTFTLPSNAWEEDPTRKSGNDGINNYNTLPFANIPYENINAMGKQWIRKYALAISKGMLAQVRGKFGAIPIPGDSVTLNASDLASQSEAEKTSLRTELIEMLDKMTYKALMEADANLAENSNRIQVNVPLGIYFG